MLLAIVPEGTKYQVGKLAASSFQEIELAALVDVSNVTSGRYAIRVHGQSLDSQVSASVRAYPIWPTADRDEYLAFQSSTSVITCDTINSSTTVGLYLDSSATAFKAPFVRVVLRFECSVTPAASPGDLTISVGLLTYL